MKKNTNKGKKKTGKQGASEASSGSQAEELASRSGSREEQMQARPTLVSKGAAAAGRVIRDEADDLMEIDDPAPVNTPPVNTPPVDRSKVLQGAAGRRNESPQMTQANVKRRRMNQGAGGFMSVTREEVEEVLQDLSVDSKHTKVSVWDRSEVQKSYGGLVEQHPHIAAWASYEYYVAM